MDNDGEEESLVSIGGRTDIFDHSSAGNIIEQHVRIITTQLPIMTHVSTAIT